MSKVLQHLVSKQKRRLAVDGFDLDLSYITEQVIAMGLPCTGLSGIYRNPQSEVISFLNTYHEDRYLIYNLCTRPQDQYDVEKFAGRVMNFPFEDHGVPPLKMVDQLAHSVSEWLEVSADRVVCIHCLAGKGRTGLMVCASLLLMGKFSTAAEAMAYYGVQRMKNKKGVTQASQRRWVEYYQQTLSQTLRFEVPRTLVRVEAVEYTGKALSVQILAPGGEELHDTGLFPAQTNCAFTFSEDVCLQVCDEDRKPMAQLWLHAAFIDTARLVCDKNWFDLERHNSKSKRLKKATIIFTFESEGGFDDGGGKTWPPSTDGWYSAIADHPGENQEDDDDLIYEDYYADAVSEGRNSEAEEDSLSAMSGSLCSMSRRSEALGVTTPDDFGSALEDGEVEAAEGLSAAEERALSARRKQVHFIPAIKNLFGWE